MSKYKAEFGMEKRADILIRSLLIENLTSFFLGSILGIKDISSSRTLGNKSSSLSFNQKIDLLIDLGALNSVERKKFQAFMEIRNQLMHNLNASTYEKCFSCLNGTDKLILKLYPSNEELDLELRLEKGCIKLAEDVTSLVYQIIEKVEDKLTVDFKLELYKKLDRAHLTGLKRINSITSNFIRKKRISKANAGRFRELGSVIFKELVIGSLDAYSTRTPDKQISAET